MASQHHHLSLLYIHIYTAKFRSTFFLIQKMLITTESYMLYIHLYVIHNKLFTCFTHGTRFIILRSDWCLSRTYMIFLLFYFISILYLRCNNVIRIHTFCFQFLNVSKLRLFTAPIWPISYFLDWFLFLLNWNLFSSYILNMYFLACSFIHNTLGILFF